MLPCHPLSQHACANKVNRKLFRQILTFAEKCKVYDFTTPRRSKGETKNGWEIFHTCMEDDPLGPVKAYKIGSLGAGGKSEQKKRLIKIWEAASLRQANLQAENLPVPQLLQTAVEQLELYNSTINEAKKKSTKKKEEGLRLSSIESGIGLQPAGARLQHSVNLQVAGRPEAAFVLEARPGQDLKDDDFDINGDDEDAESSPAPRSITPTTTRAQNPMEAMLLQKNTSTNDKDPFASVMGAFKQVSDIMATSQQETRAMLDKSTSNFDSTAALMAEETINIRQKRLRENMDELKEAIKDAEDEDEKDFLQSKLKKVRTEYFNSM